MIAPPDYAEEERTARLNNAETLRANLYAPEVRSKVVGWAERLGLEPEFVHYKVLTDDLFALHFIKDPSKQTLHQRVAAKHIKSRVPLVSEFQELPSSGPRAEYVVHGMVVPASARGTVIADGKSIDFKWLYRRGEHMLRVYATHKYTKQEGGSQDNQFSDLRQFMAEARHCIDPNMLFLAICDGEYYRRMHESKQSRLEWLQHDHASRRVDACSIATLPEMLGARVREWLLHHRLTPSGDEAAALEAMGVRT